MTPETRTQVERRWQALFEEIERSSRVGAYWPASFRDCAGAWYVLGILYEEHHEPQVSDAAYDALSAHLLENLQLVHDEGADLLDEATLRAGTAMGWREFPKPYHDVAAVLAVARHRRRA